MGERCGVRDRVSLENILVHVGRLGCYGVADAAGVECVANVWALPCELFLCAGVAL